MSSEPPTIVPTPATLLTDLRGRRVIVGIPGVGFRADLRADDAVTNGGRTFVPVLTEQDYYRAEIEQLEVFAPLVPIDRVWVEQVAFRSEGSVPGAGPLDTPLPRIPTPVTASRSVLGRRLVQAVPDGFVRDLRAVTDAYPIGGAIGIRICGEAEWYKWALTGATPDTSEVDSHQLWVE